jgi:hypothetical protein
VYSAVLLSEQLSAQQWPDHLGHSSEDSPARSANRLSSGADTQGKWWVSVAKQLISQDLLLTSAIKSMRDMERTMHQEAECLLCSRTFSALVEAEDMVGDTEADMEVGTAEDMVGDITKSYPRLIFLFT